jgi:hypothetical protein
MTGKQVKGKGFGGALRYNLDKVDRNVAEVLDHNFARVSERSIMKEIDLVRMHRPNLQKFFYHTSINFPPSEDLSSEKMKLIGKEYLEMNGFTQHQFIMFRHFDAEHPHLHILVNRIGYDGSVVSDSNDYARSERVIRELEKKHGLTEVISSKQAKERSVTQGEVQLMKRIDDASQKVKIQVALQNILKDRPGLPMQEFINSLEAQGVNVLFNRAKTGHVSGISYGLDGFMITGSKLGNAYKWTTLKHTIDYEQERDSAAIHKANDRTRNLKFESAGSVIDTQRNSESIQSDRSQNETMLESNKHNFGGRRKSPGQAKRYKRSTRSDKYENRAFDKLFSKEPKHRILENLLYSNAGKADGGVGDEYYVDPAWLKKGKRKKRGKSL